MASESSLYATRYTPARPLTHAPTLIVQGGETSCGPLCRFGQAMRSNAGCNEAMTRSSTLVACSFTAMSL